MSSGPFCVWARDAGGPFGLRADIVGKTIEAQRIHLVDSSGRIAVVLAANDDGSAILAFQGAGDMPTALFGMNPGGGSTLSLSNTSGYGRLELLVGRNASEAYIALLDGDNRPRIRINLDADTVSMQMHDARGRERLSLALNPDGEATIEKRDEEGNATAIL